MAKISTWSTTAGDNNSASPDGFPENMAPSGVNNAAREVMAQVRAWYEDAQWIDLGDAVTYATASTFTIATDVTATYHVGRRVKCTDSSTMYGTITASSYSAPNTTVTVSLDSGSLSASLTAVALSILTESNHAIPRQVLLESDIGTGLTVTSNTVNLDASDLTAEATISGANDYLVVYDTSATATRKAIVNDVATAMGIVSASTTTQGIVELATSAEAAAGTDTARAVTPAALFGGLNATGSAPIYAARAWVNFNGTGTVAINAGGNVSSITDNGTGDYTVNFTTAMSDANYAPVPAWGNTGGLTYGYQGGVTDLTTSSFRMRTHGASTTPTDRDIVTVAVFR